MHTLLPSLLLVPAVPTACSDIVHSSIAASPGSEAMVFSLTPRQSPSASLSLSPLLLPRPHSPSLPLAASLSSPLLLLLLCPRVEARAGAEESVCVWGVCVSARAASSLGWSWRLPLWLASVCRLPHTHTHIHTYTFGRQPEGGRDKCVCQSLSSQLERGIGWRRSLNALSVATPSCPTCLANSHFLFISLGHELTHRIPLPLLFTLIYHWLASPLSHSHLPSGKYLTDGLNWTQQHVCEAQGQWSVIDLLYCSHKAIIYSMSKSSRVCPHVCVCVCMLFKHYDHALIHVMFGDFANVPDHSTCPDQFLFFFCLVMPQHHTHTNTHSCKVT